MSAKQLLPNQCIPLHLVYGTNNCCLCKAKREIEELKEEIARLKMQQESSKTENVSTSAS